MLTQKQVLELISIIESNNIIFIAQNLGNDYLTQEEKDRLKKIGINSEKLYLPKKDFILQQFYLGLISDAIGKDINKVTYDDVKKYIASGKYIPLTYREKASLDSIRKQFFGDIKAMNGKIFQDINHIVSKTESKNRKKYEEVIRNEIERGKVLKQTNRQISNEIHHKTGDWSRNFDRIVEYIGHQAFDEGRAALYEKQDGEDALVYKDVYAGACKRCIELYLTKGIGSQPKIFKLSELRENGTNIGRKADELKPVIGSTHPFCRCTVNKLDEGMMWSDEEGRFVRKKEKKIEGRKPVKIFFGEKEYFV